MLPEPLTAQVKTLLSGLTNPVRVSYFTQLVECDACHGGQPATTNGGPHGLHFLGQNWVDVPNADPESRPHADAYKAINPQCQVCHGTNYRGTVLSRAQANRTLDDRPFESVVLIL